jgi:hypothetical protein
MLTPNFNYLYLFLITFASPALFAQPKEVLSALSGRPAQEEAELRSGKTMVVNLPFRDDFSGKSSRPNPNLWLDANVYINQTTAEQPHSIGTATFDGIDPFGRPYDITFIGTDTADILTSQPVNLTGTTGNVILSFYYQPQGKALAEAPENQDSLALYFYNAALGEWSSQWRVQGSGTKPFQYVAVQVDPSFLQNGFQFRFVSYGAGAGAYDMWHLDYVILDDQRNLSDTTTFNDLAFTAPHPPLLNGYESVPWFHYDEITSSTNNLFKPQLSFDYIIHSPFSSSIANFLGVYRFEQRDASGSTVLKQDLAGNPNIDLNHVNNTYTQYNVVVGPYANTFTPTDEFSIEAFQSWNGPNDAVFPNNDTVRFSQKFKNYYAYDDGTAERGYGVENVPGALTLVKYDVLDAATLKGLYIYFLPAGTDVEQNDFQLVVYTNNGGIPGSLIYQSDSAYQPQISEQNFYFPYVLDTTGININGSVFIGVKQRTIQRLNIGFDINRNSTSFFFGAENNLYQSFLNGTLMMRPFFNYLPRDISLPETPRALVQFDLFPNPAQHLLHLSLNEAEYDAYSYSIHNVSGQVVMQGTARETMDISALPNGMYIVKLKPNTPSAKRQANTKKLMIAR